MYDMTFAIMVLRQCDSMKFFIFMPDNYLSQKDKGSINIKIVN